MQLIDGKAIADQVKQEIAQEVAEIKAKGGKVPHLAVIIVGHDGGSETYVAHKVKSCEQVGFKSTKIAFEADITEEELLAQIDKLNKDEDLDGFIVQLPLPKHISEQKVIEAIDYILATKVFRKFESLNLSLIRDEIKGLIRYLDTLFGKGSMVECRAYLERLQKMYQCPIH